MRNTIFYCIIQLSLLSFGSNAKPLKGQNAVNARKFEFPFIASLRKRSSGQHFCSGTLVTTKYVLTAAQCLRDKRPEEIRILFGIVDLQTPSRQYNVLRWRTSHDWTTNIGLRSKTVPQDIAIMTLLHSIDDPRVEPIRLSELNKQQVQGKSAILTGWGGQCFGDPTARELKKARVNILSDENCLRNIGLITNKRHITAPRLLCTAAKPFVLSEDGDCGAPLVDGNNALLGINIGSCPDLSLAWGDFPEEHLQQYQVNLHISVDHYRLFIFSNTNYN